MATFPESLCGWFTRLVEEWTLKAVGFGGGEVGIGIGIGMLTLHVPLEHSLEFTCGTETSVACILVTHIAVITGAELFLSQELSEQFNGPVFKLRHRPTVITVH